MDHPDSKVSFQESFLLWLYSVFNNLNRMLHATTKQFLTYSKQKKAKHS